MSHPDLDPYRRSYRWQDHVVTPRRAAASLLATVLVILVVGAAAMLAYSPRGPAAHAVAAERMPSLPQQATQPDPPHDTEDEDPL